MQTAILETPGVALPSVKKAQVPFGMNEMRLDARQWIIALAIVLVVVLVTPRFWKKVERFETGPDYRIPYSLSKDYWLYQRHLQEISGANKVIVLGDSVVWGEYVLPNGTLSHFLNQETGESDRFVNAGVNGLFPLAMEGLVENYARSLRNRKVIVQCNVLWMSSPKADLRVQKEETFNHSRLVPQFRVRIPCYRADAAERLSVVIEHHVGFSAWVGHLQNTYFDQRSIPNWTLEDDGRSPPQYPNSYRNPLKQINLVVPGEPREDPQRGPSSARHVPWNANGAGPTRFDWVDLEGSLQWHAFQRVLNLLRDRGNDVFVILGPFNEHMIAPEQRPTFRAMRDAIDSWLATNRFSRIVPETLPSELYADASHPLTPGYQLLAKRIYSDESFRKWASIEGHQ